MNSRVVLHNFPFHPDDYAYDVRGILKKTIEKYGEEEWRLIVLTSEMHGHLGVYAIIGAKMGIFAREILNVGHDELIIVSYAGYKPPVSCLNDGLQVSTGATLGHGLITTRDGNLVSLTADFTHKEKTIRIALKDGLNKEIEESIKEAYRSSAGLTNQYWQKIRELALNCWLEYDRSNIFNIQNMTM